MTLEKSETFQYNGKLVLIPVLVNKLWKLYSPENVIRQILVQPILNTAILQKTSKDKS